MWAGLLAFIAATWKFIYPVFKLAKGGKLLLTGGSMLVSVWFYALIFGWKFAVGFVLCIFVHEMGHVFMAWRLGIPVSAPIFLPGMGAVILSKRSGGSAWRQALIGIGGPLFGFLAAIACYGIYMATQNPLFLGLSLTGFLINLFNMIPMYPLDGGWITGAVSPYIWVVGMVALLAMAISGLLRNPFIYVLIFLSLPRLVESFKRGTMDEPGTRTTVSQKATMGLAYVTLCGLLAVGVAVTGVTKYGQRSQPPPTRPSSNSPVVMSHGGLGTRA